MTKLFCYVDESGQDILGKLFVVSVVITEANKDKLENLLIEIEKSSKKGRRKWQEVRKDQKIRYFEQVIKSYQFRNCLKYSVYKNTREYIPKTILTTARAIVVMAQEPYKASIFIDGLPKSQTRWFGTELRHLHIKTEKVRGVKKEESSALMRLADALAGFVRDCLENPEDFGGLMEKAKKNEAITEI